MSRTRAELRRARRAQRPAVVVAVLWSASREFTDDRTADRAARFALALVTDPDVEYEWEWVEARHAPERLASLVRANPPKRLRRHYNDLRVDIAARPDGWVAFARVAG